MAVPGIINPFSKPPYPSSGGKNPPDLAIASRLQEKQWLPERRPHPSTLPPPEPLARKRGWQPSSPEPSAATTITASTSGYLNARPRYRDFTVTPEAREEDEVTEMAAELPPAKRRRTLASTIVSGALNAAIIGTAVGLTVYRLWRDRGKVPELEPPPYEQGDWVPSGPDETAPPTTVVATPSLNKKSRSAPDTIRRGTIRHRRARTHAKVPMTPPRLSRHTSPHHPTMPGPDPDNQMETDEIEDKMEWMGDRLAQLIEDGKKALGKEVVVKSEVQEDEVDDGSGNWEEEVDPDISVSRASRSGSVRRRGRHRTPGTTSSTSYLSPPPSASPRRQQLSTTHLSQSCSALPVPVVAPHDYSADTTRLSSSFREDESQWQSPELRESMERARQAYLRNRQ